MVIGEIIRKKKENCFLKTLEHTAIPEKERGFVALILEMYRKRHRLSEERKTEIIVGCEKIEKAEGLKLFYSGKKYSPLELFADEYKLFPKAVLSLNFETVVEVFLHFHTLRTTEFWAIDTFLKMYHEFRADGISYETPEKFLAIFLTLKSFHYVFRRRIRMGYFWLRGANFKEHVSKTSPEFLKYCYYAAPETLAELLPLTRETENLKIKIRGNKEFVDYKVHYKKVEVLELLVRHESPEFYYEEEDKFGVLSYIPGCWIRILASSDQNSPFLEHP